MDWAQDKWFCRNGGTVEKGKEKLLGREGTLGTEKEETSGRETRRVKEGKTGREKEGA